ncbi:TolC family protein [Phenylobacterium sp.]|uniref:TolC family protein n=1 Tax=Phenylobacterium sp. TaxID=1871053 RepID=UPI00301BA87C
MPSPSLGARIAGLLASVALAAPAAAQTPPGLAQTPLGLPEALARASGADPSAAAAEARLAAAEAGVRQAAVRPNASLDLQVENFAGSGPYSVVGRSETTLSYERPLERGGKREARTAQARAEAAVVRLRAEVLRLDFLRDVQTTYAEALAAEAELLIADARLVAVQASQRDVVRRVKGARDPLFAASRAEALTAQAEIERDRAREAARTARAQLAATWDGSPDFTLKLDDFFNVTPPDSGPSAGVPAGAAPDAALLEAERDVAAAALRVARTREVADPTLRAGVRYFGEGDEAALVIGGSIPLGVRASARAGIDRARAEHLAAEQEIAAERTLRDRRIARLEARMRAMAVEAERIRAEVVPHAIRTVEQVTAGFNRGGFEFRDVAEAERALADARTRRVEVLRDFHMAQAELDRLTGRYRALAKTSFEERR